MAGDADLALVGGNVFTADPTRPWAKALAVRGGRIVAVGTDAQAERWAGRRTRRIDLRGRVVVPGFIDAHAHLADAGGELAWTDLWGSRDLAAALARLRKAAGSARPGAWIVGKDWDEQAWPERRYLTRADLDAVAADRPVVALRRDRHMASLNSKALEAVRSFEGLRGLEVDAAGRPTGVLKEDALDAFWPAIEPPETAVEAGLARIAARAHRLGITSIHDVVDAKGWRAYQRAQRAGRLKLRVYAMPRHGLLASLAGAALMTGLGDPWLRLGAVKVFSDGSLGAYTAALAEPYEGRPGDRGMLIHSPDELRGLLETAHRAGFQTATHAIGDAAIRLVVETLEAIQEAAPRRDARHRIEHFELPDAGVLRRTKAAGIIASCQPNFVGWCSGPGGTYETRLGPERARHNSPFRRIVRGRIPMCFGSDGMPYGPLEGIHWAVNGFFPDQRVTVEEAVRAYTAGGAYASFEEREKGTLAVGRLADFVVLHDDPFAAPDRIDSVRIDSTWIDGRVVFVRSTP